MEDTFWVTSGNSAELRFHRPAWETDQSAILGADVVVSILKNRISFVLENVLNLLIILTLSFSEMQAVLYHGLMWVRNPLDSTCPSWVKPKRQRDNTVNIIWANGTGTRNMILRIKLTRDL